MLGTQEEFIYLANRTKFMVSPIRQEPDGTAKITVTHELDGKNKFCIARIILPADSRDLIKVSCGIYKDEKTHIVSREEYDNLPSVMEAIELHFFQLEAQDEIASHTIH